MPKADSLRLIAELLDSLGGDSSEPRLAETPRIVAAFLERFVAPRDPPSLSLFPAEGDGVVRIEGLRFYALCEHHLVPFFGTIDVIYAPVAHVAGFGGIERCVTHFATRLQLQERMTREIADYLESRLQPRGLRIVSRARQMCLEMTGGSPETVVTVEVARGSLSVSS